MATTRNHGESPLAHVVLSWALSTLEDLGIRLRVEDWYPVYHGE